MRVFLDFETRSEVDLKACGPWVYAEHHSTEIMCLSYKIGGGEANIFIPKKFQTLAYGKVENFTPFPLYLVQNPSVLFEAHNAEFERAIWFHILHNRHKWPDIPIERWRCSAAKSSAMGYPRKLDDVAKITNRTYFKDSEGHRLMLKLSKPRRPRKSEKIQYLIDTGIIKFKNALVTDAQLAYAEGNMPTLWPEEPEDLKKLFQYCKADVNAEYELSQKLRELSLKEQRLWFFDQKINQRGIPIDLDLAQKMVTIVEQHESLCLKELKEVTNGLVDSTRRIEATKKWLATRGVNLPDLQKETVANVLSQDTPILSAARTVLEIRQSLGKSSTAKISAMINRSNSDGRVRGTTMYHGASTGRWAGKGIQPQNLPRPDISDIDSCLYDIGEYGLPGVSLLWGDPMMAISSCVRSLIKAQKGKDFICSDLSSIEAVVINYLAQASRMLQAFRDKRDIYKLASIDIHGGTYETVTDKERQIGKVAVLALGYQGSYRIFQRMASVFGIYVDNALAKKIVRDWRQANQNIVNLWYNMEYAAVRAVKQRGSTQTCSYVKWGVNGKHLFCLLPSGRLMAYYDPIIKAEPGPYGKRRSVLTYMGMDSYTYQYTRQKTYGGKLVENVVQAIARDLLAEAIPRMELAGYPVVLHVHDEILSEVDEGTGSVEEHERLMAKCPEWFPDCPISASGWRGKRYKK